MQLPSLYIGSRRALFHLLVGNGLLQGVLAVVNAWLVMRIFDHLGTGEVGALALLAGLGLAILFSALLRRQERVHAEALGQRYARSVRRRLYARLLDSNPRMFRKRRKGGLLLKFVGDLSALRRWISLGLARLLVAGVAVSMALAALAWLHWPFAAGVTTVFVVSAGWILWHSVELRAAIAETRHCQASMSANVTEKLNNLSTVQAFGQGRRERRLMRRQSNRLFAASVRKAAKIGTLRAVIDATVGGSILMVLGLASYLPPPDLSAGMVAAVISIIGFLTPPLRDLGRSQEYWLAAQVARDNLHKIARHAPRLRNRRGGAPLVVSEGRITFDAVTVQGALQEVHAEVDARARVAVVGPNGSGKSTLLHLVGRLFDPDEGRILIDGQDISKARLTSLRRQVAYVSADIPLIRGSLRKNLCYGAGKVEPDRLLQVIEDCEFNDLLERLPEGLETRVAEGGADLSQGERVRVGLARALLLQPGILLLDEADANLDGNAITALGRVIESFGGTVLMATHRRDLLRTAETLWILREGSLQRQCAPSSLLRIDGSVIQLGESANGDGLALAR